MISSHTRHELRKRLAGQCMNATGMTERLLHIDFGH